MKFIPSAVADLVDCRVLDELKPEEIVSVLSVFTPIRLSQDMAYVSVKHTRANDSIKNGVHTIKNFLDKYYDVETKYQTNFTDSYSIHYDMCDFTYQWCLAKKTSWLVRKFMKRQRNMIFMWEIL